MNTVELEFPKAAEPLFTPAARKGLRSPTFRWSVAPALAAWVLLLVLSGDEASLQLCIVPRATRLSDILAGIAAGYDSIQPMRSVGECLLMIVAMMFPLLVPAIGFVAARSFATRRDRSVGLFVAGYAMVWVAAAAAATASLIAARGGFAALGVMSLSGLIGCALAALWQLSPKKKRAVNRCHGTVALRPFGFAADWDAMRFGLFHGGRCVRSCAPTMVLPLLGAHTLGSMAVLFMILLAERANHTPQYGLSAVVLLMLGLTTMG